MSAACQPYRDTLRGRAQALYASRRRFPPDRRCRVFIKGPAFYNVLVRVIRYSRVDPRPLRHTPAPPAFVGHVKGRWLSRLHVQGHLSHAGAEILEDTSPEPVSSNENAFRGHSNVLALRASHADISCEQPTLCCVHPPRLLATNIHCTIGMACVSIRRAS